MKINKNVVLEYLYLTIFVITLFVLKELIEYVFFTRKRNNIIEKFSDTAACGIIEWYYEKKTDIEKIFNMFNYSPDGVLTNVTIPCQNYVEFKTVTPATSSSDGTGSRIVLEPINSAIYFESLKWTGDLVANADNSPPITNDRCIVIKVHTDDTAPSSKRYLDFASYTYVDGTGTNKVPFYSDNTSTFDHRTATGYTTFARFDIDTQYDEYLNFKINDLTGQH